MIIFISCTVSFSRDYRDVQENPGNGENQKDTSVLGIEQGFLEFETPHFTLKLVKATQTAAALKAKKGDGFDFTPSDRLDQRDGNGFFHLGDLNVRLREEGTGAWEYYSTATERYPVEPLLVSKPVLAASDLSRTLPDDIPLQIRRYWETDDGYPVLRFEMENRSDRPVEIGALGIPMIFNNDHTDKSLEEAHLENVFYDPYIGGDAGYLQVTRLNGAEPALLVVPHGNTPFEAYNPLLDDPTPRGITFEGFYEWMVHSRAFTDDEWSNAEPWNRPTSEILEPGESRSYGVKFLVSETIQEIEPTLIVHGHPVAVGIPGYVLPMDQEGRLFVNYNHEVDEMVVEPEGALEIGVLETEGDGWQSFHVRGREWGRARLIVTYRDGIEQTIHYKVIKPQTEVVDDLGIFLLNEQWYENPDDPFGRHQSVISYDYEDGEQVTEDRRAWIPGLSDEGGAGSWLAAFMKQLIRPDREEIEKLETFMDGVLWGGIQYSEGEKKYGVRKSMFYYEPEEMPEGTYNNDIDYSTWAAWDYEEASSVGRSFNYLHVAAAHWVFYHLARNHEGLVTNHSWKWYLERAYETAEAMVEHAPHYSQFGQMEGTIFLMILRDLQREGWEQAEVLEETMRDRAEVWASLPYPFGSEMPWDSTGQEEIYTWSRYFGFDEMARATLNAILAYMPALPHWGYNGSARRYWDFIYAGKITRLERQLHHYGSGLNAIPVLSEFRNNPADFYLLRVGYGGLMGSIANITQQGFGPSGFHAYPSTLDIDGYSGDYGPGFFGHAMNTATYIVNHPTFGRLVFGGDLEENGEQIQVSPRESAKSRIFLASRGVWLTLDAGMFKSVSFNTSSDEIEVTLDGSTRYTPKARLRIAHPAEMDESEDVDGLNEIRPAKDYAIERGAYIIPLDESETRVRLVD